uniref:Ig-like domain-containing protein n=1 Tax=Astatotilapia calliptera TaxID=8154 RepID=A0A3P8QLJ5_ASTCA
RTTILCSDDCEQIRPVCSTQPSPCADSKQNDVTLQCQISTDERISVLKWSRADLNTDGYVYFYRNKRFYENYQHPSFHGRVKLKHPEMKDGDVSVILKNVTFNDTGMYECHVAVRNPVRSKRVHTEISHFINLTVTGEFVYTP